MSSARWLATPFLRRRLLLPAGIALLLTLTGCAPRQLIVGSVADELATQSQGAENDLELAREASAFYLKFSYISYYSSSILFKSI